MIQLQADEGIPIPPSRRGKFRPGGRKLKYPWDLLDAKGKSLFFIDLEQCAVGSGAIQYWSKRTDNAKFSTRSCVENGVKGVRIWRTA